MGGTYRPAPVNLQALASCARHTAIQTRGMIRILCVVFFAAAATAGETVKEPELSPRAERMLRTKLRNTRIPKIDFKDSTVREAIDFLVTKSKDIDLEPQGAGMPLRIPGDEADVAPPSPAPGIPGLPDVSKAPSSEKTAQTTPTGQSRSRITLRMKNASLEEIFDAVCRQAKLRWKPGPNGIIITPLSPPKRQRR